ncbi:MAG TPA: malate synthase A [Gemmatimonadales bacterium]|jgi:malate synthase|nr:malate synthase A [Gemmatimonadales bacterium]
MPHPRDGLLDVTPARTSDAGRVLTAEALAFVARLGAKFESTRQSLLERRRVRQADFDAGRLPDFLAETAAVRRDQWRVAPPTRDLEDRRVEITGPVERKMMINALNSGARVFMADFEDALSPTWENVVHGQANLQDAIRRTLTFTSPEGKAYRLAENVATLVVRPRGWHLDERHATLGNTPVSASLFDFGLYFFHNARELMSRGSGPYFYLPKLESHLEARLWNDVFVFAERDLGIPPGTIRCTVLIETILGAFEMDEILYELREHGPALNAGRWDYMFSIIKKFRNRAEMVLPDRVQVTMTVPFMRAYTELLVATCHRRGAHAIGGMAAFIPSRRDAEVNAKAIAKVTEDKDREAGDGFDGTWVAHPDLVPVAQASFDNILGNRPHQKDRLREDVRTTGGALVNLMIPGSSVTEAGVRTNVSVAVQYLASWLAGVGAAGINNLMEDAATAEISRAQLWQWIRQGTRLADGRTMTRELYTAVRDDERKKLGTLPHLEAAVRLLDGLVLASDFTEFLTIPAYRELDRAQGG